MQVCLSLRLCPLQHGTKPHTATNNCGLDDGIYQIAADNNVVRLYYQISLARPRELLHVRCLEKINQIRLHNLYKRKSSHHSKPYLSTLGNDHGILKFMHSIAPF